MEDAKIVQLYWDRNEEAIQATSVKYGSYCRSIAVNILGNNEDSEECVNDTYLNAWNSMPPHRPRLLSAFLGKITRNLAFNKYRYNTADKRGGSETAAVLGELSECVKSNSDTENTCAANELERFIASFVRTLSDREGDIFVRRYFFTEPIHTIANRYGLTKNNINVILSRTRSKLRKELIKEGYINE